MASNRLSGTFSSSSSKKEKKKKKRNCICKLSTGHTEIPAGGHQRANIDPGRRRRGAIDDDDGNNNKQNNNNLINVNIIEQVIDTRRSIFNKVSIDVAIDPPPTHATHSGIQLSAWALLNIFFLVLLWTRSILSKMRSTTNAGKWCTQIKRTAPQPPTRPAWILRDY